MWQDLARHKVIRHRRQGNCGQWQSNSQMNLRDLINSKTEFCKHISFIHKDSWILTYNSMKLLSPTYVHKRKCKTVTFKKTRKPFSILVWLKKSRRYCELSFSCIDNKTQIWNSMVNWQIRVLVSEKITMIILNMLTSRKTQQTNKNQTGMKMTKIQ